MTLTIDTTLGVIKVVSQFKISRRLKKKIEESLKLAVDETKAVDELLEKIGKDIPWADTPRGSLVAYMTGQSFTQKKISEMSGIPQGHISQMVNGKRSIGPAVAKKLGRAFRVDYHKFL